MKIHFLGAYCPLVKSISPTETESYPLVEKFTSYTENVSTAKDLAKHIVLHADQGHCLLKGNIKQPLVDEPRRGSTNTDEATQFICLDFDKHEASDIETLLATMGLSDISYILQYSASHGLPGTEGTVSAHVFMLLEAPIPAPAIKSWLMEMNLTVFRADITLSRSKNVLHWPLDITSCQNDRLLFIAPPTFIDIKDPLFKRITYVPKPLDTIPADRIPEKYLGALKHDAQSLLNALRKAEGLKPKTERTVWVGAIEVSSKPDVCTVTGIKQTGDFIRLNINGDTTWAHWHPINNFELIHSFRSDTWYKTKELIPQYYAQQVQAKADLAATPTDDGDLILAFRDLSSAVYYNGLWNPAQQHLELYKAKNETQLDHWMKSHGRTIGTFIPIWNIEYQPRQTWIVDADNHKINTFQRSQYMNLVPDPAAQFPHIMEIIKHMLGWTTPEDNKLVDHFINWFACIFQRKHKPLTAWVAHGVEGCLATETQIVFRRGNRSGGRVLSIKEAYEKWNGIYKLGLGQGRTWDLSIPTYARCVKDELTVGYSEVFRIVESGVKMLYRVVTDDGGSIRITYEHPFMRPDGSFTKLCDLKVGDLILKRGEKNAHCIPKGRNKARKTIHSIPHHPYAWQHIINGKNYKRSHKARLVWEANMNGLSLEEFVHILRHDPKSAMCMQYLDPSIIVHHLDEDCTNDNLNNLEIVDKLNHDAHHARHTGLGTIPTVSRKIISITKDREEMTYDMTMKAPYHNYVANDFCVSNTGKGYFVKKIVTALLNATNVQTALIGNLEDSFNAWMEGKLFVFVDEIDVDDFSEKGRVTSKLKNYITESTISSRGMRAVMRDVINWTAFFFSSNMPRPVCIPLHDRRYNVGNFQARKLPRPDDDAVSAELEAFAQFLLAHKADIIQADSIIETEARKEIQKLGVTSIDQTCQDILAGDFEALWMTRPDEALMANSSIITPHSQNARAYCMLMRDIASQCLKNAHTMRNYILSRDEILIILQYNVGNMPVTPNKFTTLLRHHGIITDRFRKDGLRTYGTKIDWQISEEFRTELQQYLIQSEPAIRRVK